MIKQSVGPVIKARKSKTKFQVKQVVMEKFDSSDYWKVAQISWIHLSDYYMTDGRLRRARQLRSLTREEQTKFRELYR